MTKIIAMMISLLNGTMAIKTKGSKNLNKKRGNTCYLAPIKVLGLLYVRR